MKMILKNLLYISLLYQCFVFGSLFENDHQENKQPMKRLQPKKFGLYDNTAIQRSERGIGSILFYGASILVKTTSLGLSVASAVTKGCSYYPSICRNKKEIGHMDSTIKRLKVTFDKQYVKNVKEFVELQTASTNNEYIRYYINETVRAVEKMNSWEEKVSDQLEAKMPTLSHMAASYKNLTADAYLDMIIGRLEYSLTDIRNMIQNTKNNQLMGLAVQFLVEIVLNRFIKGFQKAYNQVLGKEDIFGSSVWTQMFNADPDDIDVLMNPKHPNYKEVMKKYGIDKTKLTKMQRLKIVPKVFKQMGSNIKKYFSDKKTQFRKWTKLNSWKGFKGKLKHSLKAPLEKMKNVKKFFTNSKYRKQYVKSFKLGWSQRITIGLGVIADIISTALNIHQWSSVAKEMEKAKNSYKDYLQRLKGIIEKVDAAKKAMTKEWENVISSFKGMSVSFETLIKNISRNSDFNNVIGLPSLPKKFKEDIFKINFNQVNRQNIAFAQGSVIQFLKDIEHNFTAINEEMQARYILYDTILKKTSVNESVDIILSSLKDTYNYNPSNTARNYGSTLSKKDIVCTIAISRPDKSEYDFYSLNKFRPRCDLSVSAFSKYETIAQTKQNRAFVDKVVKKEVERDATQSVSGILVSIKNSFMAVKDPKKKEYAEKITEQDVICSIAYLFPKMNEFDYFSLKDFRLNCSQVSNETFSKMKKNAVKIKSIEKNLVTFLGLCDKSDMCLCLASIQALTKGTLSDITAAIKRLRPQMTKYCASPVFGCPCVDL